MGSVGRGISALSTDRQVFDNLGDLGFFTGEVEALVTATAQKILAANLNAAISKDDISKTIMVVKNLGDENTLTCWTLWRQTWEVATAGALAAEEVRASGGAAQVVLKVDSDLVQAVIALRRCLHDAQEGLPAQPHWILESEIPTQMDPEEALISACDESSALLAYLQQWWIDYVTDLDKQIRAACPPWELKGDTLLDEPDVLRALFDNPMYGKLGALVENLNNARLAFKKINNEYAGPFIGPDIDKSMKRASLDGAMTVSTTFAAFKLTNCIMPMANHKARNKELDILKKALNAKGTPTLCKSIEDKNNNTNK